MSDAVYAGYGGPQAATGAAIRASRDRTRDISTGRLLDAAPSIRSTWTISATMDSSAMHQYSQRWINKSAVPVKLFLAHIVPENAGELPPHGFELCPGQEWTLSWSYAPSSNSDRTTGGYLRWWSCPSRTGLMGSGTTFGIKLEEHFPKYPGEQSDSLRISTYNGSPTGNPMSFTDVTGQFANSQYQFRVPSDVDGFNILVTRLPPEFDNGNRRRIKLLIEIA
ncbi:hypothetical protein CALCODRAFT_481087 [Calocera cornea HHB12733]|uniref:Uncharacterized protein n=1 Tax=Calocera cornea HHB12733 TaxID=1353952 RepID=A0A165I190_9BASI|nr:hypothetical protein CALCODRAFT_481087 [Calocera cornea HHB12733]